MKKFQAVIFDMDGTMFDTETLFYKVQSALVGKRGKTLTIEIKHKIMGQRPREAVRIMLDELGISEPVESVYEEQTTSYMKYLSVESNAKPGLFTLLDLIAKNDYKKALATGSTREWVDILLNRFNLKSYFDVEITDDDILLGKPNPEIFQKAVNKLGLKPSDCIIIEDSPNGVKAGKAAGCFTVVVPNEYTKGLDYSSADLMLNRLDDIELINLLDSKIQ